MQTVKVKPQQRIDELDLLKSVFIVLMIVFHLTYIGNTYPLTKSFVYTFHMPAFLIISGYLLNTSKPLLPFLKTMFWIFLPYAVMESGYTVMASMLPVRDHVDNLTLPLLLKNVFASPIGPYWYLHTLVLCSVTCYAVLNVKRINHVSGYILCGALCFVYFYYLHIVSFSCACYFLAGVVIRHSGVKFLSVFRPSLMSLAVIVGMSFFPTCFDKATFAGVLLVYMVMSFCLYCFSYVRGRLREWMLFVGRNTLILLVFSPVFTVLSKLFQPYLMFDKSGMVFMLVATMFTMLGCFAVAVVSDKFHISRFFFGKDRVLN